jgi:hypothetical protein
LLAVSWGLGAVGAHFLKALPWSFSTLVGFAVMVLIGTTLRTVDQLRAFWRTEESRLEALRAMRHHKPKKKSA